MSTVVKYSFASDASDAFNKVKSSLSSDLLERFGMKADIQFFPDQGKMCAKGKGFELNVDFGQSSLNIDLNLGFLLKPFHSKVISVLETEFKKVV